LPRSPKSMKGSQIHLALAHWKWHTPWVEKLFKALHSTYPIGKKRSSSDQGLYRA
jgi:hypothetical protein